MAARASSTVAITIAGPLAHADLAGLFKRTCALLEATGARTLVCDVAGVRADAVALDALARLALAARRRGCAVRLNGAEEELLALVALAGLQEVLGDASVIPGGGPTRRGEAAGRTAGRDPRSTGRR